MVRHIKLLLRWSEYARRIYCRSTISKLTSSTCLSSLFTDIVLQDLCDIVEHNDPTRLPHTRQYFRKVLPEDEAESKTTLGVCAEGEVDQEWETRASQCSSLRPTGDSGDSHDHEDHDSHDHEDSSASSFMTADTVSSIAIIAATVIASVF